MKHSPYITWAKQRHGIPYNLAGSGMPGCPLQDLVSDPQDILKSGSHEEGWIPLMEKIAVRYEVEVGQVVPVHSASLANHLVFGLLVNPGDEVLVEHPVYEPLQALPRYFHAETQFFSRSPERQYQPDPDAMEELLTDRTKLIVLSNLHNPSGTLLDRGLLKQIVSLAENRGCHLLIDEVYLEFLYRDGKRTAAALSPAVITTRSLTKAYGLDDIRAGWIIAEKEQAKRIRRLADLFMPTMAFSSERLALAALNRADEMLVRAGDLLERNFPLVEECIENHTALSWHPPEAGTVGFVKLNTGDVDALVDTLEKKYQTVVAPGRFFGMNDYFRIGWGMDTDVLKEGLSRLSKVLKEV